MFERDWLLRAIDDRKNRWTDLVASPDFEQALLIVGEKENRIVTFAHGGPANEHPGDLEIYTFYAHPAYWGTGAARALMEHILDLARARGHDRVYLSAYRESGRARHFYEKLGYVETGYVNEWEYRGVTGADIEYVYDLG